jgi:hypothetical protein
MNGKLLSGWEKGMASENFKNSPVKQNSSPCIQDTQIKAGIAQLGKV